MFQKISTTLALFSLSIYIGHATTNMMQRTDSTAMHHWVDSIMNQLSPDERLGQLIIPIVDSRYDDAHRQIVERDVKTYHVGGLLFSKGTMTAQAKMTKYARSLSNQAPLWIALDGEWGISMRIKEAIRYPRNGYLGTIRPEVRDSLMYVYGLETARQCRLMGININFAPVLDINSNPNNPVIGNRSFGSTIDEVIAPALAYSRGLEEGGVMAVGKHFPGHGDTDQDSHTTLPRLTHDRERMLSFECAPFRSYAEAGYGGMMIAHLEVPSLDSTAGLPSSLSRPIVTDLLRGELGFEGLTFTDGLAMKGVNNIPDYSVKALLAGIDVLVDPVPLKRQWSSLKRAVADGTLPQSLIDEKCRRVLCWKYVLCVAQPDLLDTQRLQERINTEEALALQKTLNDEVALAKKMRDEAPAQTLAQNTASTPLLTATPTASPRDMGDYDPTAQALPHMYIPAVTQPDTIRHMPQVLNEKFYRVDSLIEVALQKEVFPGCQVLVAQRGQIIYNRAFGWMDPEHTEPVTLETVYDLASVSKAAATVPALMKAYDEHDLKFSELLSKYIPQLRGTDKAKLTLRQALLHETDIRDGYSFYAMTLDTTSYEGLPYSSQQGAPYTIQQDKRCWFHEGLRFDSLWVSNERDSRHTLTIAEGMYLNPLFRDSILHKIIDLKLRRPHRYRYSCLNFVLVRQLIENVTHTPMDQYLYQKFPEFYGDGKLCFNPLEHGIPLARIAPTEDDMGLRHQRLRGYVHDETCAWSGGVEGNAGLFGSASQLYPVLQMFLNGGLYQGKRYVNAITVERMTTQKSRISRRGLGFDKPEFDPSKKLNPCCTACSPGTYGHTGYTGTCFWVDPQKQLIYIFLCNRIAPHRWNTQLGDEDYRPRIQALVYEAIKSN